MKRILARLRQMTRGRTLKRGLTAWTAVFTVLAVVAVAWGLVKVRDSLKTTYDLGVLVVEERVVDMDGTCEWQIDVELTNPNERNVSIISFEFTDQPDSRRGILALVEPTEIELRTFRFVLDDCSTDTDTIDTGDFEVVFRLTGSTLDRSKKITI